MVIFIGADHRGFALKERLRALLADKGYDVTDVGARALVPDDDYVDYAAEVAKHVQRAPEISRGIFMCGSGAGGDIALNKFKYVRSVLGLSTDQVYAARHDDDVNALTLAADFTDEENAEKMVTVFLSTPFAAEEPRYMRRLGKLMQLEG